MQRETAAFFCYDEGMKEESEKLLRRLQEAQVAIAVEQGLRQPGETAARKLDAMKAFWMILGMLLIAGMAFVILSSHFSSLSSDIRHAIVLCLGVCLLINEVWYQKEARKYRRIMQDSTSRADAYHSENAWKYDFLEPTDFAPHVIAQLIKEVQSGTCSTLEEALDAYDGRITAEKNAGESGDKE